MDDHELLKAYAERGAEDAFKTLTERYTPLVYSAAMRQTRDSQSAEDITQAVFLTLARKAATLSRNVILSGWLLRTTRYAAVNAQRLKHRRQHYEREAMQAQEQISETDAAWQRIAPILDEAIDCLPQKDRDVLALRFFEGMPLRSVAKRLGVSEDGAQKRVARALDKLRRLFDRRGRAMATGAIAAALSGQVVQSAPSISLGLGSQNVQSIAHATLNTLARIRMQIMAIRAAALLVLLGTAALPFLRFEPKANASAASPLPNRPVQTMALRRAATAAEATRAQGRQLLLRVVDSQSDAPVSDARLTLVSAQPNSSRSTNIFVADGDGVGLLFYSAEPIAGWSHRVEIFRDGYVPKFVSWSEYQQDRFDEIPAEYTVKVDPAVTIGGVVVNEQEQPVPEARIVFSVSGPTQSRSRERLTMMGNYHAEVADANGRWSCSHVPARFGMITFKPTHPQFQDKTFAPDSADSPPYVNVDRIPEADFMSRRAIMQLKAGLIIAGVVMDEHEQPIAGAKVIQHWSYPEPQRFEITGQDGAFRFENGRPKQTFLTVQAAGFAPIVTSIVMKANAEQLRLVLPVGKMLLGRVVDENGAAITGAWVTAAGEKSDPAVRFEWRAKTDADGRFSWDAAPVIQEYAVSANGFENLGRLKLAAGSGEQVVRLARKMSTASVRIFGQLLDDATREPIGNGSVQIWQTRGDESTSTTTAERANADGKFRLKTSADTESYILEGKAEGYWPKRVTNQVSGNSEIWLDLALTEAPQLGGFVFTPAGAPAQGATLVVCGPRDWAQMIQPGKLQIPANSSVAGTVTDDQGRFRLPLKHAPQTVVVAHPEGFISAPFTAMTSNTLLRLQPWARIEGTAWFGSMPLAGQRIRLSGRMDVSPRVLASYSPTADPEGRFAFDTVPPGKWMISREVKPPLESSGTRAPRIVQYSHSVMVEARPGETSRVVIGGSGQTVLGKAIALDPISPDLWTANSVALTQTDPPAAYQGIFNADGSFRIDDVTPGNYILKIALIKPVESSSSPLPRFQTFAVFENTVTISADSDADLGVLNLKPAN